MKPFTNHPTLTQATSRLQGAGMCVALYWADRLADLSLPSRLNIGKPNSTKEASR